MSNNLTQIVEKFSDSEYPVKVLVLDSATTWAIDLAHQLGLKGAAFFTQSRSLSAICYHMDPETSEIPLDGSVVSLPSLPLLEKEDLPSFVYESDVVSWLRTQYPIKTIGPTVPSMYLDKRLKDDK
ncbi:hypothetical protein RND71_004877 [Anisodus tanguticus]|uniref:Uncharacterized protein n=1 Tax=Anisodus tanguticus TaxID=243964 RepID=A0AAE1VV35_9SOLA|nr:hypothetical protein RND71_004877 [Anisodus tanguticus]